MKQPLQPRFQHRFQMMSITQLLPAWLGFERVQTADLQRVATVFADQKQAISVIDFFENAFENTFFSTTENNVLLENEAFDHKMLHKTLHDAAHTLELQVIEYQEDSDIQALINLLQNCHFKKTKRKV